MYELSTMIPRAAKTISTVGVGTRYCVTARADHYRLCCSWAKTDSFDALRPGAGNRVAVLYQVSHQPGCGCEEFAVGACWSCVVRCQSRQRLARDNRERTFSFLRAGSLLFRIPSAVLVIIWLLWEIPAMAL